MNQDFKYVYRFILKNNYINNEAKILQLVTALCFLFHHCSWRLFSSNRATNLPYEEPDCHLHRFIVFTSFSNKHLWRTEYFQNFSQNMNKISACSIGIPINKLSQGYLILATVKWMGQNKRIPDLKDLVPVNLASKLFTLHKMIACT